ncbi:hypothetical protein GOP47_0023246 [Adiantum capillus-veneris]|uniref:Uncharacterized protein n=1 Tax=Adiantum capillus-veneris TaxID=13818 RepID=A0A9D4Z6S4_ADICA|nr:hypothetical protein GOP47_0023246 [Adiantum capillus-veneris]
MANSFHGLICALYILSVAIYSSMITCNARPLMRAPSARMLVLVSTPTPLLTYHGGALVTAPRLRLHVVWYGDFPAAQQGAVADFIASFQAKNVKGPAGATTVGKWWRTSQLYKDSANAAASAKISKGVVFTDAYSRGKNLTNADLVALVEARYAANKKTRTPSSMYVVITADDVLVEDFCMNSCGTHDVAANGKMPFIWVGNPGKQCPGLCAWPFAIQQHGPPGPALTPPSGDVATDGIIINLATLLAGAVTNPFASGYFQGDPSVPLEAGSACQGKFGAGSYPGYAGKLFTDPSSSASFNAFGINGRQFLLPALWNPSTCTCEAP